MLKGIDNRLNAEVLGAALMVVAGAVQAIWGLAAERQPLEQVARPLSHVEDPPSNL